MERRIYVSVNSDRSLDARRRELKRAFLRRLETSGFSPQLFFESGLPLRLSWSFAAVDEVMRRCQGALVLGFPRWRVTPEGGHTIKLVGEYSHFEGGIALVHGLPTLIVAEDGIEDRGIVYRGGGRAIASLPHDATAQTLFAGAFGRSFDAWLQELSERRDIFLGYCSKSEGVAAQLQIYLERTGAKVHNWSMDFRGGASILDELEHARRLCSRGVFLFSEDDPLEGRAGEAAPRDNVVFEVGYFMGTKGPRNCLIVRMGNAKMPADLGGAIYLGLDKDESVSHIEAKLQAFVNAGIE